MPELLWILGIPTKLGVTSEFNKGNGFDWVQKLSTPRFPSASLDSLLELSDEVTRVYGQLEQICKKMELDMAEFPKIQFAPKINGLTPSQYLQKFSWNESDYALQRGTLYDIISEITRSAHLAERGFREAYTKMTSANAAVSNAQKMAGGPLQTRSLTNIIYSDSECWFESENMTTIVCIVQRHMYESFLATYHTFSPYIVPYSAFNVTDDENSFLVTLIVMKDHTQDVIVALRREKIGVRDFTPQPKNEVKSSADAIGPLEKQAKLAEKDLADTAADVYPAVFKAVCYIAIVRAYIESTLKFGLRDSNGKEKSDLLITKVTERSEKIAKQSTEQKILKRLYISETKVLGHDAKVYDAMEGADSFLPFVFIPLVLDTERAAK